MKWLILLAFISCTLSTPDKQRLPEPTPVKVSLPTNNVRKTPIFVSQSTFGPKYAEALNLVKQYGNSDEFFNFVAGKRTYFSHANNKPVAQVIMELRNQLERENTINIHFYTPVLKGNALGGWDGEDINQNTKFVLTPIERAGHLLHEVTHKYGWIHQGNYTNRNDNANSVPYAIGYDFREFLYNKEKTKLAAE